LITTVDAAPPLPAALVFEETCCIAAMIFLSKVLPTMAQGLGHG
jgi:hypothetical protein